MKIDDTNGPFITLHVSGWLPKGGWHHGLQPVLRRNLDICCPILWCHTSDQNGSEMVNVPMTYHDVMVLLDCVRNGDIKVIEPKPVTDLVFLFDLSFFRTWSSSTFGNLIARWPRTPKAQQGSKTWSHKEKTLHQYTENIFTSCWPSSPWPLILALLWVPSAPSLCYFPFS